MPQPRIRKVTRVTITQYEQALLEVVERARLMNVPRNAISQSMTFAMMLSAKLFGLRDPKKRSKQFQELVAKVVEDARVERAEAELKQREAEERDKHRIILTGN